jgi:nitroimidazol reductase NimA-like FMN-containing flavoprotein (pyridoxamine 5'-phosphate oxidase superfamily)
MAWTVPQDFDLEAFLARPLVARVATSEPAVRPVWFIWEDEAFWWITGAWSKLERILAADPHVAIVIDSCDLDTGEVKKVYARGTAEVVELDHDIARRKLSRYLGTDESKWDPRFVPDTFETPGVKLARLVPTHLSASDASFVVTS